MSEEKVTYNACQGWGCHEHCVLTTYTKDGKIQRTERTILKGSQAEHYGICQKGIVAGKFPYIEDRVLYPLKRVGKRGEGKFERISWEQALDEIGAKINELRDKYGPRSLIINNFPCGYPNNISGLGVALSYGFTTSFDASLLQAPEVDASTCNLCSIDFGDPFSWYKQNIHPLANSNYVIIWGGNPIGWTRAARTSRMLMDIQERGGKLVDITPFYESTAAKADETILIKPGTDAAFAMAMARVIIEENLYDEDFLIKHTVAPFLVRDDNGKFLRESDIAAEGDPEKYVYWNKVPAKAMPIAAHTFEYDKGYPDLDVKTVVNGISCKTAFAALKEHLAEWSPERQEAITGVPAETVYKLTREYIEHKPSTIFLNYGLRYINGTATARAIALLPYLSGNLGLKNGRFWTGSLGEGHPVALNDMAIMFPTGLEQSKGATLLIKDLLNSFSSDQGQQYKAIIVTFSNPVQNWPNRKMWTEDIFPNLELIVDFEVRMSDTAKFADYVLPEASIFEREDLICPEGDCVVLNEPAIEPQGEAKPPADIWKEIGKRVGLSQYFDKTTEEWLSIKLDTKDPAFASLKPKLTLDRLRQEKIVRLNVPEEPFDIWDNLDLETPSGRVEFYCEDLAEYGHAMGTYLEPKIRGPERKKYPLQFYPARHRVYMQGQLTEIPELRAIGGKIATAGLNPADAHQRGITEGDTVEVFNYYGSIRAKAHLTSMFPPGTACVWYAYPSKDYPTDPPPMLTTSLSTEDSANALSIGLGKMTEDRYASPLLTLLSMFIGRIGNETYWDDLCEVRKVEGGK